MPPALVNGHVEGSLLQAQREDPRRDRPGLQPTQPSADELKRVVVQKLGERLTERIARRSAKHLDKVLRACCTINR